MTLGQRLASNLAAEKQAALDSAAALELKRTAEARRVYQTAAQCSHQVTP